jgi:hypothetical protein
MNASLHHDLAIDRNMSWVPARGYVTYLTLNAPGARVTYDLGVGADNVIRLTSFGSTLADLGATGATPGSPDPSDLLFPALLIAGTLILVLPLSVWQLRPRLRG